MLRQGAAGKFRQGARLAVFVVRINPDTQIGKGFVILTLRGERQLIREIFGGTILASLIGQ